MLRHDTVAIGFKNHAAGGGSTAGQENISWGTTNFTAGYQTHWDTTAAVGTAGSAIAMGYKNIASGRSSAAFNRYKIYKPRFFIYGSWNNI